MLYKLFSCLQTFGDRVLGFLSWTMPLMVAMSALGGLSVHIMTSSRMCFVGARYGHFPVMLAQINVSKLTPTPSLVFLRGQSKSHLEGCLIQSLFAFGAGRYFLNLLAKSVICSTILAPQQETVFKFEFQRLRTGKPFQVNIVEREEWSNGEPVYMKKALTWYMDVSKTLKGTGAGTDDAPGHASVYKQKPQADGTRISLEQLRISIGKAVLESRSSAGRGFKQWRSGLARA
ncbi:Y+L amino acid transporter 2 [Homalodisca vitripennis]|nr:Y+L amino acid transporter 2 [Homalodisca vitripennis]